MPLNTRMLKTQQPEFYTGHCGSEHERLCREGRDFFVFGLHGRGFVVTPVDPNQPEQFVTLQAMIDWGEWVRVRAMSADDALAVAQDAVDQYEAWANEDPHYLEIVRLHPEERWS